MNRSAGLYCALSLAAIGCAVGPNYVPPAALESPRATRDALPEPLGPTSSEGTQRVDASAEPPAAWWKRYGSPPLDALVEQTLRSSPTLDAARARYRESHEAIAVARGAEFPAVEIGIAPRRSNPERALYRAGASATFTVDLFGRTRRQVESEAGLADARLAEWDATRLALAGNAVTQAIAIASLREQADALAERVRAGDALADLASERAQAGSASRSDVLAESFAAERDRAQLPALQQQLAAAQNALAVTAGQLPAEWTPPALTLADFQLPETLPAAIPSEVVRRRPDVRAAEARLHAANAQIGVATAARYPRLDITAALGVGIPGGDVAAALAGQLLAPVFHGGALKAAQRGARDATEAAFADYRATVLTALQQVADALAALAHDAEAQGAASRALDASREAFALAQQRFDAGKSARGAVLDAQRTLADARSQHARATAQRLADTAVLFTALGSPVAEVK